MTRGAQRALTVRNPWAWEICAGNKPVENRDWKPATGPGFRLFIHAAQEYDATAQYDGRLEPDRIPPARFGAIIGALTVAGWHEAAECGCRCSEWAMPTRCHWELRDPHTITPIRCAGRLGLWTIPDHIAARLP